MPNIPRALESTALALTVIGYAAIAPGRAFATDPTPQTAVDTSTRGAFDSDGYHFTPFGFGNDKLRVTGRNGAMVAVIIGTGAGNEPNFRIFDPSQSQAIKDAYHHHATNGQSAAAGVPHGGNPITNTPNDAPAPAQIHWDKAAHRITVPLANGLTVEFTPKAADLVGTGAPEAGVWKDQDVKAYLPGGGKAVTAKGVLRRIGRIGSGRGDRDVVTTGTEEFGEGMRVENNGQVIYDSVLDSNLNRSPAMMKAYCKIILDAADKAKAANPGSETDMPQGVFRIMKGSIMSRYDH